MRFDRTGRIDAFGTAAILAALLCWTSGPLFMRYRSGHLDAWSQNLWRYTVAMLFWLPFLLSAIRQGRVGAVVYKRAILPALANIVMQCFWAWSFYFVEPGFASLLARSSLIWIIAFSLIYFPDERGLVTSRRFWTGMIMSVAGLMTVIVTRQGFAAGATLTGTVLMLSASAAWAFYTVSARIAFRNIDSRIAFSVVSFYTVAGLAVMAVIFGRPADVLQLAPWPWACIIISGIFSISVAHTLYYASMQRIGATIPAIVLQLHPFAVLALSMIIFAERLNFWQWTGGIVLVVGSALSIWAQQHLGKVEQPTDGLPD